MTLGATQHIVPHSRPWVNPSTKNAVLNLLEQAQLLEFDSVEAFRQAICTKYSFQDFHFTSSGRHGLKLVLDALHLPPSSHVAVQSYACPAVAEAIRTAGHIPWIVDIGPAWQMTAETLMRSAPPTLGAIILAPPFGLSVDVEGFENWDCPKILDACQMGPAGIRSIDRKAFDLCVTSFHPTKYIAAYGGGVTALNRAYEESLDATAGDRCGFAPYPSLYAAIGCQQLAQLDQIEQYKRRIAEAFIKSAPRYFTPVMNACTQEAAQLMRFPALLADQNAKTIIHQFNSKGIAARHGVDTLLHRMMGLSDQNFPNTCETFERTVSLPFHPSLSTAELDRVTASICEIFGPEA